MQWMHMALMSISKNRYNAITDAVFAVIHADTYFELDDRAQLQGQFTEWYAVLTAGYSTFSTLYSSRLACAIALSTCDSLNRYHRERCIAIAKWRVFFITSRGYIGTGPQCLKVGDQASLLLRVHVPITLREKALDYLVVGAASVHA